VTVVSTPPSGPPIQLTVAAGDKVMVLANGVINRTSGGLNVISLNFFPCYVDGSNNITTGPPGFFRWDTAGFSNTSLFHVSGNTTFTFSASGTYTFAACAQAISGSDALVARHMDVDAIRFK
jgi:hypothetical protein